jgi:hypothetical protein
MSLFHQHSYHIDITWTPNFTAYTIRRSIAKTYISPTNFDTSSVGNYRVFVSAVTTTIAAVRPGPRTLCLPSTSWILPLPQTAKDQLRDLA